jgi:ubiquinone biosynthesis protein
VREHTSRRVLVMAWIEGIKITEVKRLRAAGIDVQAVADLLTDCYCRQMLVAGFFHADPHPGNLFALPGNRLAIVDFGLTKRLSPKFRQGLATVSRATYTGDQAAIVAGYRALGFAVKHGDGAEVFVATAETMRALTEPSMFAAGPEAMLALNRQWEQAVRKNPFISMPGDLTLCSRVLFLLTGVAVGMGAMPHVAETVLRYTDTAAVPAASDGVVA